LVTSASLTPTCHIHVLVPSSTPAHQHARLFSTSEFASHALLGGDVRPSTDRVVRAIYKSQPFTNVARPSAPRGISDWPWPIRPTSSPSHTPQHLPRCRVIALLRAPETVCRHRLGCEMGLKVDPEAVTLRWTGWEMFRSRTDGRARDASLTHAAARPPRISHSSHSSHSFEPASVSPTLTCSP
jgi:hypothetical protein